MYPCFCLSYGSFGQNLTILEKISLPYVPSPKKHISGDILGNFSNSDDSPEPFSTLLLRFHRTLGPSSLTSGFSTFCEELAPLTNILFTQGPPSVKF